MVNLPNEFHFKTVYSEGPFRAIKSGFGYLVKNSPLKGANEFTEEMVKNLLNNRTWLMVKEIPTKNINFEQSPEMETVEPLTFGEDIHQVTQRVLKTLEPVMLAQDRFGYDKYKKPLKHTYRYDWLQMFLEEMADGLKYIQNEMDRRAFVIQLLEQSLESDEPKTMIKEALQVLKTEGTGK